MDAKHDEAIEGAGEAFAAALRAGGIEFATAFPGSPTTSLAQRLEADGARWGVEFRWAINENVALSQAFGAAMGGRGAAALMKHVGVNVAADALHAMGVVHGLPAPLLLIEGADAKPGSSQSAQDNRSLYASSPQLLVIAPTTVAEIVEQVQAACEISRRAGMLVVVRGDARCFAAKGRAALAGPGAAAPSPYPAWPERGRSLSTSARTYGAHLERRAEVLARLGPWVDAQVRCWGWTPEASAAEESLHLGLVVAAHLGAPIAEAARARELPGLRLGLEHPLPAAPILALARRVRELVVLEECTPTLELQVRALLHREGLDTRVVGRAELGDRRPIGRLVGAPLDAVLDQAQRRCPPGLRRRGLEKRPEPSPELAAALDGLPAHILDAEAQLDVDRPASGFPVTDPRKTLFSVLRELGGTRPVFIATDPGITGVLALAAHGCDVKMHMGGAVAMAAGWSRARPEGLAVCVLGDTNLPHSEWLGLLDAIDHGDDLLIVVADNGASEMTQNIVTPRLEAARARASLEAAGLPCQLARASLDPSDAWAENLRALAEGAGPRLLWLDLS